MRGTCSSMMLLLIACAATAGCSLNSVHPEVADHFSLFDDPRFASANARTGVWMPSKFQRAGGEGIYFLDHYDRSKIPFCSFMGCMARLGTSAILPRIWIVVVSNRGFTTTPQVQI
jgi:hypothetical protein